MKCICGASLPVRSLERATYVLDGKPVCSFNCYMQNTMGPESDWDCPGNVRAIAWREELSPE